MESTETRSMPAQRTRSVACRADHRHHSRVGLVVVPIGPIPFTLQMFAITFAIVVLSPKEAIAAITGYLLLGAVGVPVFSGMRGGIGVLAITGGFLWVPVRRGGCCAVPVCGAHEARGGRRQDAPRLTRAEKDGSDAAQRAGAFLRSFGVEIVAGIIFTAIAYACRCAQYMVVGHVDLATAFLVAVAPFVVVDFCKIVAAVICADAVRRAGSAVCVSLPLNPRANALAGRPLGQMVGARCHNGSTNSRRCHLPFTP